MPTYVKQGAPDGDGAVDAWIVGANGSHAVMVLRYAAFGGKHYVVFSLATDKERKLVTVLAGRGVFRKASGGFMFHDWEGIRNGKFVIKEARDAIAALYEGCTPVLCIDAEPELPKDCAELMEKYLIFIASVNCNFDRFSEAMKAPLK